MQSRGNNRREQGSSSSPGAYRRDYQSNRFHKSSRNISRSMSNSPSSGTYSRKSKGYKQSNNSSSQSSSNYYDGVDGGGGGGKNMPSSSSGIKPQKQQRDIPLVRVINGNGSMYTQTLDALALYSGSLLNNLLPKILQANDMESPQNQYGVKSDPLNKVLDQQDFAMIQTLGQSIKVLISQLFPQQTLAMQKQWDDNKKIQQLFSDANYNNLDIYSTNQKIPSNQLSNQKVVHLGETSKLVRRIPLPNMQQNPGVNLYGILIGPGNSNQKKMEEQTGCKIIVKGVLPNQAEQAHIIVIGESQESINYTENLIKHVISSDQSMGNHMNDNQQNTANFQKPGYINQTAEIQDHLLTPYGPPSNDAYVVKIPSQIVGLIIGKGGETIRSLSAQSGAKIQVAKADIPNENMRNVFIEGSQDRYLIANELIMKIVEDHKKNQQIIPQIKPKEIYLPPKDPTNLSLNHIEFPIPLNLTGMVIGKGGDTLKSLMQRSGAEIEVPKNFDPNSGVRILTLRGNDQVIEKAKYEINTLLSTAKYMKSPISGERVTLTGTPIRQPQNNNLIRPNMQIPSQTFANPNQQGNNFRMMNSQQPSQSTSQMMMSRPLPPPQNSFGGMNMMNQGGGGPPISNNPMMVGANRRPNMPGMMSSPHNPMQPYRFNQINNYQNKMNNMNNMQQQQQQQTNKQFQMPNQQLPPGFSKNYPNQPDL